MKKRILYAIVLAITATLMLTLVAACGNESDGDNDMPEYVFVPEFISIPEGISFISGMAQAGDNVFIIAPFWDEAESTTRLYSLNLTTNEVTELTEYTQPVLPASAPQGAQMSTSATLSTDHEGNLWALETGSMFHFDVPDDFDGEEHETWQFYQELGPVNVLRMLDVNTGAEVKSLNMEAFAASGGVNAFEFDSDGNVYILAHIVDHDDMSGFGSVRSVIFVLDSNTDPLFRIELDGWGERLIRLSDGSVGHFGFVQDADFTGRNELQPINLSTQSFDESIPLPTNASRVFSGNEQFDLLFLDNATLYGIDFSGEEPEVEFILNLTDSDIISTGGGGDIIMLADGRVLTIAEQWGAQGNWSFEIVVLSKTPSRDLPERGIITMATMWMSPELQSAVVNFNRTSTTHRINVTDYSQFNTEDDWNAGLTRLTTEIISGRVPDILDVQQLPIRQYASRGLLLDLNELIASDPELSRDDFVEGVFEAAEMDGRLFQVFPSFSVRTLAGHPSVLGPTPGWNMEEFRAVLAANPNADIPMGQWISRSSFLHSLIIFNMDQFVDWVAGEAFFDTGDFAELLEFAATFPTDEEMFSGAEMGFMESESDLIAQGRQIVTEMSISDLSWMNFQFGQFGGELVFKGFPTEHGNGSSIMPQGALSITTSASDVDGAWSFVRTVLTEGFQNDGFGLPTNRAVFDRNAQRAMEMEGSSGAISWGMGRTETFELEAITRDQIEQIIELIRSASGTIGWDQVLVDIITEGADDFFGGRGSAQDAARVIQSRVTTYIHEQG
ncbi:MAG: extracellular solute-binding protein [Oscillospiraceae bacterium]|nr:extracellular solute-binding protein [Oscillospiraceae bacterium]